ncbi:ABC transporter permease [Streptomyces aurantiacus]|uniref:Putative aliphatic sulfonates transport permease protein SsuC n=1 Tax=Streptomyces aurantiacus JA 4570 TaxID=1286094 RepID=S4A395_9ACTN|nr:ABC transporter permease [Streptomyces aurantiacus]EPH45175.1 putative aliphatic sulfonates transport permease protein SsuC [Streptomyces aurantiacus JA 4570]
MSAAPAPRAPLRRILDANWPYQLLTFALFAAVWELYARQRGGLLLPGFAETARATVDLLGEAELWRALYVSNQALALGFGIAVVAGVPAGIVLGRFRLVERYADVYLNILLVTPMAAIIPLLVMSVGVGLASRVLLVAVFSIVMVVVNSRTGVRQVDPSLIEMARSFGAGERQIWARILLPGALPAIMTGVRLGIGRAVTGMVIVELLMVSDGLGGLILTYRGLLKAPLLYGTIVIILAEALLLISVARWAERKLTRWARTQTTGGAQ